VRCGVAANRAGAEAVRHAIAARCGGSVHLVHVRGHDYGSQTRHRLAVPPTQLVELTGESASTSGS
jgi:hypothetical protein